MAKKSYTKEFKLEAVKLVSEQGLSSKEASSNLGLSLSTLNSWIKKFKEDGGGAFPGSGKLVPSDQKVRDLEKKLKQVTMERDILKKAIGYFTDNQK
jgi:transposase